MYKDIFEKIEASTGGPIGQYREMVEGYFTFPKLEGELGPHMQFNGQDVLVWSLNNYMGLANHPAVRKADAEAAAKWGMAYPMGSRMLTGHTALHEELEKRLAAFEKKEAAFEFNFGYQGIVSTIDSLVSRHDVIVYDTEAHACLLDGIRLHIGSKYKFKHNDIVDFEKVIARACKEADEKGGGVLVITEGVFGMTGALGIIDKIVDMKKKYRFRLLIDDAHGFGIMGPTGRGTSEHFNCMDGVDLYIGAYAKSMATIGGFVASEKKIIDYLKYNMRSQMYAKALPMPIVEGCLKRLEIIDSPEGDELRKQCWLVTRRIQNGFRELGFDIGPAEANVTPVHMEAGINQAANIALALRQEYKIFCSIVTYPVIPPGMIIFRIIPTAAHSIEDVDYTLNAFKDIKERMARGEFDKDIPQVRLG